MFSDRGSFEIGRPFGIRVRLHWSFLVLVLFFALESATWGGAGAMLATVVQLASVFFFVTLHELGHSLTARRFGLPVRAITLWPLGGVAEIEGLDLDPKREFWIAIAGPAVNLVLAFVLAPFAALALVAFGWTFPLWLTGANLVLALFNLIPAFPMDGGRILRAFLAARTRDPVGATRTAVSAGKYAAVGLGAIGLFFNPWLILVAFFVWTAGERELQAAVLREAYAVPRFAPWPVFHVRREVPRSPWW